MGAGRTLKEGEPQYRAFAEPDLRRAITVVASRSHAVFGYNTPEVQVRLPPVDQSAYAVVEFVEATPVDARGHALPFELEHGLYDHESHSTEVRFRSRGKDLVPMQRATGRIRVRYPLRVRTVTIVRGQRAPGLDVALDGPYVTYTPRELAVPEGAPFAVLTPVRAYDASGRRLEPYTNGDKDGSKNGEPRRTRAFWGEVVKACFDLVDTWGEVEIPFDVPARPLLPAGREGLAPEH